MKFQRWLKTWFVLAFLMMMALLLAACDGVGGFELGFFKEPFTKVWLLCAPVIGCITVWK